MSYVLTPGGRGLLSTPTFLPFPFFEHKHNAKVQDTHHTRNNIPPTIIAAFPPRSLYMTSSIKTNHRPPRSPASDSVRHSASNHSHLFLQLLVVLIDPLDPPYMTSASVLRSGSSPTMGRDAHLMVCKPFCPSETKIKSGKSPQQKQPNPNH